MSTRKTRIVQLKEGFDFLGFNIRRYPSKNSKSGWKLCIKPSKQAVQRHRARLKAEWKAARGHNLASILIKFNPLIRGWANYNRKVVAKRTFQKLDHWMYLKRIRYTKRTHPHKPWHWRRANTLANSTWTEMINGCLETNKPDFICSSIVGLRLSVIF